MKHMKKSISIILTLSIFLGLTACGGSGGSSISDADVTDNPGYESLLITYDENFTPWENSDTDLVTPYLNSECECTCYRFGARVTSLYAFLENNRGNKYGLGAFGKSSMSFVDCEDYLEGAWGITDRDGAKATVEKMLTQGHQAKCRAYIQKDDATIGLMEAIKAEYGDSFSFAQIDAIDKDFFKKNEIPTNDLYKVKAAACAGVLFGENALAGYDYMRMLRVIAFSEDSRFLSTPEYLEYVYNITCALQKQYKSFEEIHQCYYLGEMFRSAKADDKESLSDLEEILEAMSEMKSDGFYAEIEAEYGISIVKDWDDILITRKELRER